MGLRGQTKTAFKMGRGIFSHKTFLNDQIFLILSKVSNKVLFTMLNSFRLLSLKLICYIFYCNQSNTISGIEEL